jgi:ABC-type transport system involved in cytochrome c biogenesis permease subunit
MSKKNSMDKMTPTKDQEDKLVFDKINYQIMIAGIGLIILGFIIMMMETGEYGIGFLGLTLGPVIVVLGFAVEFAAILYKPKKDGNN